MDIKKLTCPECGANFESNEKISFCSHCGAKLFIDDGTKNININYKTEDVTRIKEKEIELNKEIELKKMKDDNFIGIIVMSIFIPFFIYFFIKVIIPSILKYI